jgi:hypothetical protein
VNTWPRDCMTAWRSYTASSTTFTIKVVGRSRDEQIVGAEQDAGHKPHTVADHRPWRRAR